MEATAAQFKKIANQFKDQVSERELKDLSKQDWEDLGEIIELEKVVDMKEAHGGDNADEEFLMDDLQTEVKRQNFKDD